MAVPALNLNIFSISPSIYQKIIQYIFMRNWVLNCLMSQMIRLHIL